MDLSVYTGSSEPHLCPQFVSVDPNSVCVKIACDPVIYRGMEGTHLADVQIRLGKGQTTLINPIHPSIY